LAGNGANQYQSNCVRVDTKNHRQAQDLKLGVKKVVSKIGKGEDKQVDG
jgi:hypothetical protein